MVLWQEHERELYMAVLYLMHQFKDFFLVLFSVQCCSADIGCISFSRAHLIISYLCFSMDNVPTSTFLM